MHGYTSTKGAAVHEPVTYVTNSCGTLDQIKARVEAAVPGAHLQIVPNASPASQPSLLVDNAHAVAVARFLRDDPGLRLDYASNVTGVDWLDTVVQEKRKVKQVD